MSAPLRLFLDANVLFTAAHNPKGKAALLFEVARLGHWKLLSSTYTIAEAQRNITAKYPQCGERLTALIAELETVPHQVTAAAITIELPEKDLPVFFSALQAKASHLLTGDLRHFGPHMNKPIGPQELLIQTVAEFLAAF